MRRLRALLVGVAEYPKADISRLPCVLSDLEDLRTTLESHGYSVEVPYADGRPGRTDIMSAVSRFLQSGKPEDTLVIYLSGHGCHIKGDDYLVPSDAEMQYLELREVSVSLTYWRDEIDRSRAGGVVFLVDACREGIEESKTVTRSRWSVDDVQRAARRQVVWIYPCAPGEVSRWVRGDGTRIPKPFSLFARSVVNVLRAPVPPVTLEQFESALREAMDLLTEEHSKSAQSIRLVPDGQSDPGQFELFPPEKRKRRDWEQAAASHPAWDRAAGVTSGAGLRPGALALVRNLAKRRQAARIACQSDPWTEAGQFALRMTNQMIFILSQLPRDLTLTQAEAALIVAMPFLLDTHEAVRLGNAISHDMPGNADEWREAHKRIADQSDALAEQNLSVLLAAVPRDTFGREVFTPARIWALIRAVHAENSAFAPGVNLGLELHITITTEHADEHELRERFVGILVTVAFRLTIDALALPGLAAGDHGPFGPVRPSDLHMTLGRAVWRPYGRGLSLAARCSHPAVEWALRKHVVQLDELLAHLDAQSAHPDLRDLRSLPIRAVAFHVGAATRHGRPEYEVEAEPAAGTFRPVPSRSTPVGYSLDADFGQNSLATISDSSPPVALSADLPARQPESAAAESLIRRLLEISEAVAADGPAESLRALVAGLADAAQNADLGERRTELVGLIAKHRLLRADLQQDLGHSALPYYHALLSAAFGLPLSYEAYREVEDLVGLTGTRDPLPDSVISAILQDDLPDVRVAMIALSYWEESKRTEWLAVHPARVEAVADYLAAGWEHRAHERRVLDSFLWLLRVLPDKVPAPVLRSALSRHGYLAERVATQYPADTRFQVDTLHVLVRAAWSDGDFGRTAVDDTLRGGREPLPPALVAAVLPLTGPTNSELREHANQLLYLSKRSRPGPRNRQTRNGQPQTD